MVSHSVFVWQLLRSLTRAVWWDCLFVTLTPHELQPITRLSCSLIFSFRFPSPSVTSVIKQFFLIFCLSKDLGNNANEWFGERCSSKGHTTGERNVIKNRAELTTSWQALSALLARSHGTLDCELPVSLPRPSRSCFGRYWYRRMFFSLYDFFLRTCVWFFLFLKCCNKCTNDSNNNDNDNDKKERKCFPLKRKDFPTQNRTCPGRNSAMIWKGWWRSSETLN